MKFLKKYLKVPSKSTYFSSNVITHSQMFDELMARLMDCAKIVGSDILNPNYQIVNLAFIISFIMIIFMIFISIYDAYLFRKDLVRCAFCLLNLSATFQAVTKIYTFLVLRENHVELNKISQKIHGDSKTLKSSEIFEKWMMIAAHMGGFMTVMYLIVGSLISIYPIIFYVVFNERILHFGVEIPGLNWKESWFAYALNFVHQVTSFLLFIFASIPSIFMIICFLTTAFAQYEWLNFLLSDLNDLASDNEQGQNNCAIKEKIKVIIKLHMELNE